MPSATRTVFATAFLCAALALAPVAARAQALDLDAPPPPPTTPDSTPSPQPPPIPQPIPHPAPTLPLLDPTPAASARAVAFAERYLALWSAPNPQALAAMTRSYAATVDFYGKPLSRAALLAQKRSYMQRWPIRAYAARPGSIAAACQPGGTPCTITGLLDWDCQSPERHTRSTGTASFSMTVAWSGPEPEITGESGAVVSRAAP